MRGTTVGKNDFRLIHSEIEQVSGRLIEGIPDQNRTFNVNASQVGL